MQAVFAKLVEATLGGQLNLRSTRYPKANLEELVQRFKGWVYACIERNGTAVAATPLRLYHVRDTSKKLLDCWSATPVSMKQRRELEQLHARDHGIRAALAAPGELVELPTHPAIRRLEQANFIDNGFELTELTSASLDLTGNAYWYIIDSPLGVPAEIWPLLPQYVKIEPGEDGIKHYAYGRGAAVKRFPAEQVMHFRYPSPMDPLYGYAPLQAADAASILENLMMKYNRALLENDARPDFFLEYEGMLSDPDYEKLVARWMARHQGIDRKGPPAILEGGLKVAPVGWSPRELMAPQYMNLIKGIICATFSVPLPMIEMSSASRASAETSEYSHQRHAVLPRCRRLQGVINQDYLPRWRQPNLFVAYDNPIVEDAKVKAEVHEIYLRNDVLLPNEVRHDLGANAITSDWASKPASERRGATAAGQNAAKPPGAPRQEGE